MRLSLLSFLAGMVIFGTIGTIVNAATIQDKVPGFDDDKRKDEHKRFFEKLDPEEKMWILRLAIKQERDQLAQRDPPIILPVLFDQTEEGDHPQPLKVQDNLNYHNNLKEGQQQQYGSSQIHSNNLIENRPVDGLDMIPTGLLEYLLNGQISNKFQKEVIVWLRQKYGVKDDGFLAFSSTTSQLCQNGECWDLGDIGGECCPFG